MDSELKHLTLNISQLEPQPLDRHGRLHKAFAGTLSQLWAEWSVRPEVTGMFTRPGVERLLLVLPYGTGRYSLSWYAEISKACSTPHRSPSR